MTWLLARVTAAAFLCCATAAPGLASAEGSIVYASPAGVIYRTLPSTDETFTIKTPPPGESYFDPTQDDAGDIEAVVLPERRWVRFGPSGEEVTPPFASAGTAAPSVPNLVSCESSITGPYGPVLSPDGNFLASWLVTDVVEPTNPGESTPLPGQPRCTSSTFSGAIVQRPDQDASYPVTEHLGELAWPSFYAGDGLLAADAAGEGDQPPEHTARGRRRLPRRKWLPDR